MVAHESEKIDKSEKIFIALFVALNEENGLVIYKLQLKVALL